MENKFKTIEEIKNYIGEENYNFKKCGVRGIDCEAANLIAALDNPGILKGNYIFVDGVLFKLFDSRTAFRNCLAKPQDLYDLVALYANPSVVWISGEAISEKNIISQQWNYSQAQKFGEHDLLAEIFSAGQKGIE